MPNVIVAPSALPETTGFSTMPARSARRRSTA